MNALFCCPPSQADDFFEFKGVGISCPSWEWSEIYKRWLFIQSPGSKRLHMDISLVHCSAQNISGNGGADGRVFQFLVPYFSESPKE